MGFWGTLLGASDVADAGTLKVGRKYRCDLVVAAIGLKGPSGREMVYDAACYLELEPGDSLNVESAMAALRANAIEQCRASLPGASDYRIISASNVREV